VKSSSNFFLGSELGVVDETADVLVESLQGHFSGNGSEGTELDLILIDRMSIHYKFLLSLQAHLSWQLHFKEQLSIEGILKLNYFLNLLPHLNSHFYPKLPNFALGTFESKRVPEEPAIWVDEFDVSDKWRV
jgi:hypothetical protein